MLKCICKCNEKRIFIYKDEQKLGYIFLPTEGGWGIVSNKKTYFSLFITFEKLFFQAFNFSINDVPNIKKKMCVVKEFNESLRLMNDMTGVEYLVLI